MLSTNKLIFACIAILGNENNRESEQKKAIHPPIALSEHITTDKDAVLWIPKSIHQSKLVH